MITSDKIICETWNTEKGLKIFDGILYRLSFIFEHCKKTRNKALYTLLTPIGYKIRIACLELTCLPKKCQNKLKKQIKEPHEFSAKKNITSTS